MSEQINAATTTALTASANPATVGDSVTFTAVVGTAGTGTPGGTVTFTIDGQAQDPVDLAIVNGEDIATFATSTLTQGSHTVTAAYSGDDSFDSSTSDSLSEEINAATTTTLTSSLNPATVDDSVTFTAVVATTGTGTPGWNGHVHHRWPSAGPRGPGHRERSGRGDLHHLHSYAR